MIFTHLPQVAHFIQRTHCSFAGTFTDQALSILGSMKASMDQMPAMVGATFEAMTDIQHGELETFITISKLPSGGWQYEETTTAPA